MLPTILTAAAIVAVILAGLATLSVVLWRAKSPLILRPLIWLGKHAFNPIQMRTAGTPARTPGSSVIADASAVGRTRRRSASSPPPMASSSPALWDAGILAAQRPGGRRSRARDRGRDLHGGSAGAHPDARRGRAILGG